ncbi:MAG: beta-ketoacyl-[acyl-carrier-protein] synthase family protein [Planctomycetaceae bacterium]|nr:beta-ketoacyl-[acyl-carrier-protein] synthase family protein [Planctomycetaceae bacterium]
MADSARDVVITGIGVVSPLGIGRSAFWSSIAEGRSGVKKVELLPFVGTPGCIGGEISDFNDTTAKKEHLKDLRKSLKVMCREIQLGVASAIQAMTDAGLAPGAVQPERIGVDFGANLMSSPPDVLIGAAIKALSDRSGERRFDYDKWGDVGMSGMEPLWLLRYLPNMPGCHIGIALDARGPNNSITHDEASGGLVVAEAANIIRRNRADVMITGVTGTRLHPVKACQYTKWDVLADGPAESRVRPFDQNRIGEVVAEASCTLILEAREHAEARGASILGTVLGCGASSVADAQGNADEAQAVHQAALMAIRNAGLTPDAIGHVNASGSGHPHRDQFEAAGIARTFGDRGNAIPVTALKSYMGSSGSGAGLCEIAASVLALQHKLVPQTLNFSTPDAAAPLNVVHGEHLQTDNGIFLKTSVTRMGQASAVVISV